MRTVMKYYKPYVWLIVFNLLFCWDRPCASWRCQGICPI